MFTKTQQHLIWYFTRIRHLLSCFKVVNNSSPLIVGFPLSTWTRLTQVRMPDIWCVDLSVWLTMVCWLELKCCTARAEDGAETLPCRHRLLTPPNWWQPGSPSGPLSEYPTPLSCSNPLCGSPPLLVGLSHLGFRPTTALEETLLCRPTQSTTQSVSSSSSYSCPCVELNSTHSCAQKLDLFFWIPG